MNAFLDSSVTSRGTRTIGREPAHRNRSEGVRQRLSVAIVNNMPDSALVATERQFSQLVNDAAGGTADIKLFHIPGVPRGEQASGILAQRYLPFTHLFESHVDALIVTGNEPRAARLDEEPYWNDLTQLVDWAKESDCPSLWSCLAAHGAVLHLDGIERRRLPQKKSGVLAAAVNQPRRHGLPDALSVCHSRMNELRKDELTAHGYGIVSEAPGGNVDIFTKTYRAPFLFLQGHPEYDSDSLMREYRRDVGRYLNGLRDTYPEIPENYFDNATVIAMENYRTLAERTRDIRLFESFPAIVLRNGLADRLAQSASQIFRSWAATIAELRLSA
ncbi:homoserine O-succinyltransferase [Aestuariivirga sp.]|uniref:homoserine O-acetyltransferase/O-succinyltransferase family protein n=1 Tax=Aestuariivirga sp. TaxID=2650926 RepID=UPI0035940E40